MKTIKEISEYVEQLEVRIAELETKLSNVKIRDRGPDSQRQMTESDARKIMLGEMKDMSHKQCAVELGLSYGQIYSARNGFTFKSVYKEYLKKTSGN